MDRELLVAHSGGKLLPERVLFLGGYSWKEGRLSRSLSPLPMALCRILHSRFWRCFVGILLLITQVKSLIILSGVVLWTGKMPYSGDAGSYMSYDGNNGRNSIAHSSPPPQRFFFDWCCFNFSIRSLVALLETLLLE